MEIVLAAVAKLYQYLHLRARKRKKGTMRARVFLILYSVAKEQTVQVRKKQSTTNENLILSSKQFT